jgi:hypothetical protein
MKTFFISLLLLPLLTFGQKGNITGNVFYKYNDFVGNRADAGSNIYVINKNNRILYHDKTGLDGNFKIENVDTGYVTVMIVSKNTNTNPEDFIENFSTIKYYLTINYNKQLFDSIIIVKKAFDSLNSIKELDFDGILKMPKKERKNAEISNEIIKSNKKNAYSLYLEKVNSFLADAYKKNDLMLYTGFIGTYNLPKIDFSFIKIESNKTQNIVADFQTTYF